MRTEISNLEDRLSEADSLNELVLIRAEVSSLFRRVTPTNEREFVPRLCDLDDEISEQIEEYTKNE